VRNRFYLDSMDRPDGTLWFTLVYENSTTFFVEQYNDSAFSFMTGRSKNIKPAEFPHYTVNGVPLVTLVDTKLKQISDAMLS